MACIGRGIYAIHYKNILYLFTVAHKQPAVCQPPAHGPDTIKPPSAILKTLVIKKDQIKPGGYVFSVLCGAF